MALFSVGSTVILADTNARGVAVEVKPARRGRQIYRVSFSDGIIEDLSTIVALDLCPILSTAYGLSISRPNDMIICETFRDIFSGIRQTKGKKGTQHPQKTKKAFGHDIGGTHGFNYMDDWDAWK